MKKTGILNADLVGELTRLRHLDRFVICDAGFPIPKGANVVDVSLVAGIPSMMQVLKAVLNEMIVEEYIVFDRMQTANPEYYEELKSFFIHQKTAEVSMPEFIALAEGAKLFIRTGELKPCSNIMLTSATGVRERNEIYDVSFEEIG